MKKILFALCLCASVVFDSAAQNITTVTTLAIPGTVTNSVGGRNWNTTQTNSVVIPNGQAARVATFRPLGDGQESAFVWFEKNDLVFAAAKGDVIAGPAVFYLRNEPPYDALLTLERWAVKKTK